MTETEDEKENKKIIKQKLLNVIKNGDCPRK